MCGIVGYTGSRELVKLLLDGLSVLEYRGYDSSGIAIGLDGTFRVLRRPGKLGELKALVASLALPPYVNGWGIGHTRWATHGAPNEVNAHPHRDCTGQVFIVHNGIIENHAELKKELGLAGHRFVTQTDSEVIAHLVESCLVSHPDLSEAVRQAVQRLEGAFSIVCVSPKSPGLIVAARSGPPLVVGFGTDEGFVASDIPALLPYTREVAILGDREIAIVTRQCQRLISFHGEPVKAQRQHVTWDVQAVEKRGHPHYMAKEIAEQPEALRATLLSALTPERDHVLLPEALEEALGKIERVAFVACGTSWHAALCGKTYVETLARLPVEVDIASEYRYREPVLDGRVLVVVVTQSGETADTLAALREARRRGALTLAITNVQGSMATREAHGTFLTKAGPEVGVAATKTFTAQLAATYLLALGLGERRGTIPALRERIEDLLTLPHLVQATFGQLDALKDLALSFRGARDFLYLGRGLLYPLALEGALKLKEISYIHAEGYPAGELKHGPIALIDPKMPLVALLGQGVMRDKMLSNLQEVRARGGVLISVCELGDEEGKRLSDHVVELPKSPALLTPFLAALPMQLFAYHLAVGLGCDVDQPRNLAKSVTVE